VIGRNLNQDDPDAVRVLDPHLGQSPGLRRGLPQDPGTSRCQPLMLSMNLPHLEPDHHRVTGVPRGLTRYFQQSRAEKEHHPRISRRAELPENGQAQHVPVETAAPAQVSGPQQNPAAQYLHATILTDSAATPAAPSPLTSPATRADHPPAGMRAERENLRAGTHTVSVVASRSESTITLLKIRSGVHVTLCSRVAAGA